MLVSSHVMDEASRCDRLVLMREGRVLADGSLASLLDRTGTPDIEAAFLQLVEGGAQPRQVQHDPATSDGAR
jgi:ABC-type Na+ transport system ATPase subunit NatA